jgi:TniQ
MYLLPCRPKPLPDELFSSWLIRLASTYCMQFCDFLQMLGLAQHLHNSDIDRIASASLVRSVCKVTGTDPIVGRATLLTHLTSVVHNDKLRIDTPEWPWLIPIGRSHRSGAIAGFQFCPLCLSSSEPYFRWQWRIAFVCCCPVHRVLLVDRCPECRASIHASAQGLWGLRDDPRMEYLIRMERCRSCRFDLRHALAVVADDSLVQRQEALIRKLESAEKGTDAVAADHFAVLRHIVSLIVGQNLGLERFRQVIADRSGLSRVDVPLPYEPDAEILHFEELAVRSRALALEAAIWLLEEWPTRFVDCARAAEVTYPALNRNAISVRWFNEVVMAAYAWHEIDTEASSPQDAGRRKPVRSVRRLREKGTATG